MRGWLSEKNPFLLTRAFVGLARGKVRFLNTLFSIWLFLPKLFLHFPELKHSLFQHIFFLLFPPLWSLQPLSWALSCQKSVWRISHALLSQFVTVPGTKNHVSSSLLPLYVLPSHMVHLFSMLTTIFDFIKMGYSMSAWVPRLRKMFLSLLDQLFSLFWSQRLHWS